MSMPFRRHKCSNMCQNSCQIIIRSRINWTDLLFGSDCTCFGFYFVSVFSFSVFPCYSMFFECLIFISQILGNWPPHWTTDLQHVLPFFANFWLEFNVEQRHRTINPLRDCFKICGKMFDRKCQKKTKNWEAQPSRKSVLQTRPTGCFSNRNVGKLASRNVVWNWFTKTTTVSEIVSQPWKPYTTLYFLFYTNIW